MTSVTSLERVVLVESKPERGTYWLHIKSGNVYRVHGIANDVENPREGYPPTVVYVRESDGTMWAGQLDDWHRRMKAINHG